MAHDGDIQHLPDNSMNSLIPSSLGYDGGLRVNNNESESS